MNFLKKNKIIVGVIVLIVVVLVGAFFVLNKNSGGSSLVPSSNGTQNVKVLQPSDIGLDLSLSSDKHTVDMTITKLSGVKTIEYEVDYNAKATGGATGDEEDGNGVGDVPRGVVASPVDVNGQSSIKRSITLGTCSSGTCKYDQVTSDIKFVIKVTYSNGEIGSIQASVPLN